jgi:hypothetical protein
VGTPRWTDLSRLSRS